jgi:transposase
MLMESMIPGLIADALSCFGSEVLNKTKHICYNMSPMFKKLCKEWFSQAIVTVDKYHVIKHALDFLQGIRIEEKNNLSPDDHQQIEDTLWTRKQLLTKSRYLLFKAKEKWNDDEMIIASHIQIIP